MTKKQLRIPFKDGKPCKWVKDDHDEERDNYEFEECLEIHGFVRGCSSAVMILRPANDHGEDFDYTKSMESYMVNGLLLRGEKILALNWLRSCRVYINLSCG